MMLLEVSFFKRGDWGITGSFIAGVVAGFCWVEQTSSGDSWEVVGGRTWGVDTEGRDSVGDIGLLVGELD